MFPAVEAAGGVFPADVPAGTSIPLTQVITVSGMRPWIPNPAILLPASAIPKPCTNTTEWYQSEVACRRYLARLRWREGFVCPACGERRNWGAARGNMHCSTCERQTSAIAGTIFH